MRDSSRNADWPRPCACNPLTEDERTRAEVLGGMQPVRSRNPVTAQRDALHSGGLVGQSLDRYFGRRGVFQSRHSVAASEEVDFEAGLITAYGYEVYRGDERLFWYNDFPHPNDPTLASTFPHHKHVQPDIRNHRIPAPGMSYTFPNITFLVQEIEAISG
jgi:hypothetical protein